MKRIPIIQQPGIGVSGPKLGKEGVCAGQGAGDCFTQEGSSKVSISPIRGARLLTIQQGNYKHGKGGN